MYFFLSKLYSNLWVIIIAFLKYLKTLSLYQNDKFSRFPYGIVNIDNLFWCRCQGDHYWLDIKHHLQCESVCRQWRQQPEQHPNRVWRGSVRDQSQHPDHPAFPDQQPQPGRGDGHLGHCTRDQEPGPVLPGQERTQARWIRGHLPKEYLLHASELYFQEFESWHRVQSSGRFSSVWTFSGTNQGTPLNPFTLPTPYLSNTTKI